MFARHLPDSLNGDVSSDSIVDKICAHACVGAGFLSLRLTFKIL